MAQSPTILTAPTITPVGMPALFKAGCFSSQDPLIYRMQYTFDSSGSCQDVCYGESYNVLGLGNGTDCYCGNSLPAQASKVDDSQCNTPCVGFPNENCKQLLDTTKFVANTMQVEVLPHGPFG